MKRHHHPSNNDVLGAPPGVDIDTCEALPITRVLYPDGIAAVVSFWTPTADELALLNAGKSVRFQIFGRTHAPIYIGVDGDGLLAPIS